MTQRDLTLQFKQLREGFAARRRPRKAFRNVPSDFLDDDESSPLKPKEERVNVRPVWVEAFADVKHGTKSIETDILKLSKLHKNRLLVRFDDQFEETQDKEIDVMTSKITNQFRNIESKLKHFDSRGPNTPEKLIKDNIKRQIAHDLQELSSDFRKSQKEYMTQLSEQKGGGNELDDLLGLTNDMEMDDFFEDGQQPVSQDLALQEVQVRDQEIQKLAENINELATIFKDLATLVIDQGTILDRIDYNLENVQMKTEQGLNELVTADKYSKNSRPFKCIMFLVGLIIFESLFLILKSS